MSISISFLGDIVLNGAYPEYREKGLNPFESLRSELADQDYVIGNLECIAKGDHGENEQKKPRLTTTVKTLEYLKDINLNVACLAQNHIYDHLFDGFNKTVNFLQKSGIQYIGAGLTSHEAQKYIILKKKSLAIGLLNYVTNDTNPNLPEDARVFLNVFDLDQCIKDISELKKHVRHVVVLLHWGGRVEGGLFPDWNQPTIARQLIESGADLIVGHHSHTYQSFQVYKGRHIFYSLGNFCFSDYTFDGEFIPLIKRRRLTPILKVNFNDNFYQLEIRFFRNHGAFFTPLSGIIFGINSKLLNALLRVKLLWLIYFESQKHLLPFTQFMRRKDISFGLKLYRIISSIKRRFL